MKYLSLLVLCSAISFNTAAVLTNSVEDYYWRDYRGLIPSDAIPAGTTHDGLTTYIGQMSVSVRGTPDYGSHTMDFLPATVTHRNETVIAAYQGESILSSRNSNVKILCSQNFRRYTWHTEPSSVGPNCRYVVGGQEDLVPLYIGRAVFNRQTLFGKIFSDGRHEKLLFVPYQGGEVAIEKYATLTYCY